MSTIDTENRLGISFCKRQPIAIEKGLGNWIWDEAGNKYLDFTSGWGVTSLGHSHPVVVNAVIEQTAKLMQSPNSGFTYSPARAELLEVLANVIPQNLSHMYFVNSGAEANDAAIKLARKVTGRSKIVTTLESFHGRTFNTLSVSGGEHNVNRYLPKQKGSSFVPYGDGTAMYGAIDGKTAAVIIEPVQGEGGVHVAQSTYLHLIQQRCRETGALFIVDEIQTGFCRTGKFFALEHATNTVDGEIRPDFFTMGKGIAGGFPFAAFAVSSQVNDKIELGDHGGTYCGNPLGCFVAAQVVDYLQSNCVAERVENMGYQLRHDLDELQASHPHVVEEIRGRGLLFAVQLRQDSWVNLLCDLCMENGLLLTPTRNGVVRLIPSLLTEQSELQRAVEILDGALTTLVSITNAEADKLERCA